MAPSAMDSGWAQRTPSPSRASGRSNIQCYLSGPLHVKVKSWPRAEVSTGRKEKMQAMRSRREFVRMTLKKYDWDKSGGLSWNQLKTFLQELEDTRNEPTEVYRLLIAKQLRNLFLAPYCCASVAKQGEIKWVIQMSTEQRQNFMGQWKSGFFSLQKDDIAKAADFWLSYIKSAPMVEEYFNEFDPLETGSLNNESVAKVLSRINNEIPPTPEEVW